MLYQSYFRGEYVFMEKDGRSWMLLVSLNASANGGVSAAMKAGDDQEGIGPNSQAQPVANSAANPASRMLLIWQ
jgi:hypothetical protein